MQINLAAPETKTLKSVDERETVEDVLFRKECISEITLKRASKMIKCY